jgi:predicted O-methyltransferase YrrM
MGTALKNRQALAEHFAALGFTRGVEVGVCHGEYSRVLLTVIPGLKLYGVDSYRSRPGNRYIANGRLTPWILEGRFEMLQMSSTRAMTQFPDGSLDFVFIDACHVHPGVDEDIAGWAPKVRPGGVVSGHDYKRFANSGCCDVIEAVDAYVAAHPQLVLQTTAPDFRNPDKDCRQPSWWWVQP